MTNVNRSEIEGNIVADCKLSYTATGTAIANFSVANEVYQGKGKDNYTSFFNVVIWGDYAERMAPKLIKGCTVLFTCTLRIENYTDKQNNKRTTLKCVIGPQNYIRFTYQSAEARARLEQMKANSAQVQSTNPAINAFGSGQQSNLFTPAPNTPIPPANDPSVVQRPAPVTAYSAPGPQGIGQPTYAQQATPIQPQADIFEDDIPF